jgi:hypothetical protein
MDTGLNVRPVQAPSFASVRAEPAPQRQAVRTDLPETQAVEAVADVRAVTSGSDEQKQRLIADLNSTIDSRLATPTKRVDRDETTQELVFRTVNPTTGYVMTQFPDDAILRQRAYSVQQRRAELEQNVTQKIGTDV